MLPRCNRLDRKSIEKFKKLPKKKFDSSYIVLEVHYLTSGVPRFSCVVSKKVGINATTRSTLRRVCYDAIGSWFTNIVPVWCVIRLKPSAAGISKEHLIEDVWSLLEQAHVISNT